MWCAVISLSRDEIYSAYESLGPYTPLYNSIAVYWRRMQCSSRVIALLVLQPNNDWGGGGWPCIGVHPMFHDCFDTMWPIYSESGSSHSGTLGEIEIFKMAAMNMNKYWKKHTFITNRSRNVLSVARCRLSHLRNIYQWRTMHEYPRWLWRWPSRTRTISKWP